MADEYIKREDAKIILQRAWIEDPFRRQEAFDELNSIPSADVAEVRHGMWLWELADNGWANHICSECNYTKNTDIHVVMDYEYCPHCGARMDGE